MILNLTQHKATPDQVADGVIDLPDYMREKLIDLLTFDDIPLRWNVIETAGNIAALAYLWMLQNDPNNLSPKAMIGGAPFLICPLENALKSHGVTVVYSFSRRQSKETVLPDGTVSKTSEFKHIGWV